MSTNKVLLALWHSVPGERKLGEVAQPIKAPTGASRSREEEQQVWLNTMGVVWSRASGKLQSSKPSLGRG
eukprot:1159215-Pelagomonas_calceolata.AAC.12